ncbi:MULTISPECIES: sulfite exporter TauE/SafE family protein [Acinetobacter calcoaceticus/baumannii complex]|uniref:sulfite exporter TauE/SafE family protein n=1 Tax=Acinetobacter calcoaceticus/baumannii complex TaxID=909768 RepID=UPI00027895A0|nr:MULTISPECIES: sulfite exporter TauE/SafE family protein [Acinetobacter calcoaceticus/baumannii complex]EYS14897.1 sulfite exporter TauE/SafE family protein [Acinetobacter baumannii 25569_7]AVI33007.1 sulfite exporter TauE/SafE family protein [Acinetobacter baumannii]AVI37194.1 sulfite exporter TauE/SafE family protein [Acinetobacter baumannii]EHU1236227.1 sulfite exporter TauE/SafE family protein [Acinetobacter baumannii]EHU1447897.1 sulfite exporter TauE/SafE family protein [Acinetobacter 
MSGAFEFILAGMLVGFCVGITGVGGGSLMTPILIGLFRIEPHIAIGTDLLYAAISKFCGSMVHAKKLNIVWPIVLWLAVGSIPASFGTAWVLEHYLSQSTHYKAVLTMVLGFMLTLTGVSIIFRTRIEKFFNKFRNKENTQTENEQLAVQNKRTYIVIMGIILGVFVTLSSVGAGAFGIMALVIMFPNLPMIRIIGSDVVHAVLLTLVAGLGHMSAGNVDFMLLMWLLVGSIPAIIIGTLISSRMPERLIRKILGITLFALGVNFMVHPVKAKPKAAVVQQQALVAEKTGNSTER